MGINGLLPFLKTKVKFTKLENNWPKGSIAAIDVPIFAHKFLYAERTYDGLERRFLRFARELQDKYNFEPIFVFDGEKLALKDNERAKRNVARDRQMDRSLIKQSEALERLMTAFEFNIVPFAASTNGTTNDVSAIGANDVSTIGANDVSTIGANDVSTIGANDVSTIGASGALTYANEENIDMTIRAESRNDWPQELVSFQGIMWPTKKDYECLRIKLNENGFLTRVAKYEAEALCAHLCATGQAYCAVTEDTDALAFGSPNTIFKLFSGDAMMINLCDIQTELNMTSDQFIDFCCMLGCDFCDNVHKIGPVTSYNLILKHGSWPEIFEKMQFSWPQQTLESAKIFNSKFTATRECLVSRAFELSDDSGKSSE